MAIRAIWGFDHLPQNDVLGASGLGGTKLTGFGIAYNNYGLSYTPAHDTAGYGYGCIMNNELTFITTYAMAYFNYCYVAVDAGRLTDGVSPKSVIGFRFTPGKQLSKYSMMMIDGFSITPADFGISPLTAPTFVEVVIDRALKKLLFFNNNVFKSSKELPFDVEYAPGNIVRFMNTADAVGANRSFSKFYFVDDTEDNTPCTRLGPVDLYSLPVAAVTPNTWTGSGGADVVGVMNSPVVDLATSLAPVVISEPITSPPPLEFSFAAIPGGDKYTKIYAVDVMVSAKRNEAANVRYALSASLDGVTKTSDDVHFITKNLHYGNGFGMQIKAPNDLPWTVDRLLRTTHAIQPKVGI